MNGQPFLLQLLGSELTTWFNTPRRQEQPRPRTVTLDDVVQVIRPAFTTGTPYFTQIWEDAGRLGQQALTLAAKSENGAIMPDTIPSAILRRLKRLELLEEVSGKWRVQVELTRRWITRQNPQ